MKAIKENVEVQIETIKELYDNLRMNKSQSITNLQS